MFRNKKVDRKKLKPYVESFDNIEPGNFSLNEILELLDMIMKKINKINCCEIETEKLIILITKINNYINSLKDCSNEDKKVLKKIEDKIGVLFMFVVLNYEILTEGI